MPSWRCSAAASLRARRTRVAQRSREERRVPLPDEHAGRVVRPVSGASSKVEPFLVVDGRLWRIYDRAGISGTKYPRHHGQHADRVSGARLPEDRREAGVPVHLEKEDRSLDIDRLTRQIEATMRAK